MKRQSMIPRPGALTTVAALAALVLALAPWPAPGDAPASCVPAIDAAEAERLAARIWRNESGGDLAKLLWWNEGEDFASLGIGHFIWYPQGVSGPFEESFPELLAFLAAEGVALPAWLSDANVRSPWRTRDEFLAARGGERGRTLARLLEDTQALQARFILRRMERALPRLLAAASSPEAIRRRFCALAASAAGRYALTDYVNFKGEGVNPAERYQGEGWGLLQVLEAMPDRPGEARAAFADAAGLVLTRRVALAPSKRDETRWLEG
ncbi:MAG: hypothetical protein R3286_18100, partial [Gammaproteobacteria bacterium]|nr:hypothetical protein [Gammaproteobacteria bacterium]